MTPTTALVVVDTNVYSAPLSPRSNPLAALYAPHLNGRLAILAAQTVAEIRFGALRRNWGPATLGQLERHVSRARFIPVDQDLTRTYAELRTDCERAGHGLAGETHTGDLWIAATAVRYGVPLVAHDGIFRNVPGLELITELSP